MSGTVVVVGCGLAGATAAARLHALGVDVRVVTDRPGATAMHGGGWYLGIKRLQRHGLAAPRIGEALEFVGAGLAELELEDGPFSLTDTDGVSRLVDLAPRNHARAAAFAGEDFAVADLVGVGHPFAQMQPAGTSVAVDYPGWDAFGRSFAAVAVRMEEPAERAALVEALRPALAGRSFAGLLLPPVLGLASAREARMEMEAALGLPVAEALGTLPSTPGLRLSGALRRWVDRLGVPVEVGRVTALDLEAGTLQVGDHSLSADAILLATGGVVPAGLTVVGEVVREPLAGLRVSPELPVDLLLAVHPDRPYGGALFRAGLPVDELQRPADYDGRPVHPRLFAAGDVVAGPDSVGDRCSSGMALLGGYLAAEHLAQGEALA